MLKYRAIDRVLKCIETHFPDGCTSVEVHRKLRGSFDKRSIRRKMWVLRHQGYLVSVVDGKRGEVKPRTS